MLPLFLEFYLWFFRLVRSFRASPGKGFFENLDEAVGKFRENPRTVCKFAFHFTSSVCSVKLFCTDFELNHTKQEDSGDRPINVSTNESRWFQRSIVLLNRSSEEHLVVTSRKLNRYLSKI